MKSAWLIVLLMGGTLEAKPLAFIHQSGGFCPKQCPSTTLTVHDDGKVIVERQLFYPEQSLQKSQVAAVSKKFLKVLKADIARVSDVDLVDGNPEGPWCADAPYESFIVVKGGKNIEVGADRDCHQYFLETYEAVGVVNSLKALFTLYSYSQTAL